MNHIEFYEDVISAYSSSVDLRVYMKIFYQMPLGEAIDVVETINNMLQMKLRDIVKL